MVAADSMLQIISTLFSLLAFNAHLHVSAADPTLLCNGYSELCSRRYSNVTFVGTHDSAFVGILPSQNQIKSVKDQLEGGIRFLQSQVHVFNLGDMFDSLSSGILGQLPGILTMCHTSCALAFGGTVHTYLKTVKEFLDANPEEIVTLLLTNPDNAPMNEFDAVFQSVDLDILAYRPFNATTNVTTLDQWPTLGEMIVNNQRIVVFIGGCFPGNSPALANKVSRLWCRWKCTISPR